MNPGSLHRRRLAARDEGFGLIEVLIAVGLLALVLAGGFKTLVTTQETTVARSARNDVRQRGRIAVHLAAMDLRMAGYDLGAQPESITEARPDLITIVGDVDAGSDAAPCVNESAWANGGVERITYRLQAGTVQRQVECFDGAAWSIETDFVTIALYDTRKSSPFRYFDIDGLELLGAPSLSALQRERIARVRFDLHVHEPDSRAEVGELGYLNEYYLKMDVKVRNRDLKGANRGGKDQAQGGGGGGGNDGGGNPPPDCGKGKKKC